MSRNRKPRSTIKLRKSGAENRDRMSINARDVERVEPYRRDVGDVVAALKTDVEKGLSTQEAQARLAHFGRNELETEQPIPKWRKFLAQFTDVLIILLIIAAVISAAVWLYEFDTPLPYEAIAIITIVLLNATMGYVQQERAEEALASLRRTLAAQATVIRDGTQQFIPAAELVPGDIILLCEGDRIPADARLIASISLQTMEAALTGESVPVEKEIDPLDNAESIGDQRNMVFSGTIVTFGRGRAVVTATGMQTQMGRIAEMLEKSPEETTPLQQELDRVGKILGGVVVAIAVAIIATVLLVEKVEGGGIFDVLILGVALAVAAVPEGLPAVVTAVLSIGVQRMAKRYAIVRRLAAVETLGSADVIASDKTGTLTRNEMTVRTIVTASGRVKFSGTGYAPNGDVHLEGQRAFERALEREIEQALTIADRVNNAILEQNDGRWTIQGDPTEGALIVAARKAGLKAEDLDARYPRVAEIPFSSERKLMSTVHADRENSDSLIIMTKGAPDVLLGRCSHEFVGDGLRPLTDARRAEILETNNELAGEALRTLACAFRHIPEGMPLKLSERLETDLVFVGLYGLIDPPRQEVKEAVRRAKAAGIRPIMITGDHPKTAAVIAAELDIATDGRVISGAELEAMTDADLDKVVSDVSVYARANPEHKLRIVEALKRQNLTVAVTGDGVNDAPALKSADIGIAMGITGTDVSREAADIVLADDNFATIVAAIEEGRAIFANIRKFLRYLLSSNIGEVMTMFFGVLLAEMIGLTANDKGLALPLVATQILWINLITDGAPALALGVDPADPDFMNQRPRPRGEGVLTGKMWRGIIFVGAVMAAGTLLVLDACLPGGLIEGTGDQTYAQTMAFTTLVLFQLFNVFNARSDEKSAFVGLFRNGWLWGAVLFSLFLQILVVYVPFLQEAFSTTALSLKDWLVCAIVASSVLWLRELDKAAQRAGLFARQATER
jgi:Ca2+-transporting ATPase